MKIPTLFIAIKHLALMRSISANVRLISLMLGAGSAQLLFVPTSYGQFVRNSSTHAADLLPETSSNSNSTSKNDPNFTIDATFGDSTDLGFSPGFGPAFADPTTLQGPNRSHTTDAQAPIDPAIYPVTFYFQQKFAPYQISTLEVTGDPAEFAFDIGYSVKPKSLPGYFSVNVANTRSPVAVFNGGLNPIKLLHNQQPWVERLGGGVEYMQPILSTLSVALGMNYQKVSVRNAMFTSNLSPRDEQGNLLTISTRGQDNLLTINLAAFYNTVDDQDYATKGFKARLGIDQAAPVGSAGISFTRISANATQFIPLNFFGFREGPRTLVLNLQGGGIFGTIPAYEAFSLGGCDTVRGFDSGNVGSGSRFIQATTEYRFPILNFNIGKNIVQTKGILFVDYGSILGSKNDISRDISRSLSFPGSGSGYGFGIHFVSSFAVFRLEFGLNSDGGNQLIFAIGDRF